MTAFLSRLGCPRYGHRYRRADREIEYDPRAFGLSGLVGAGIADCFRRATTKGLADHGNKEA